MLGFVCLQTAIQRSHFSLHHVVHPVLRPDHMVHKIMPEYRGFDPTLIESKVNEVVRKKEMQPDQQHRDLKIKGLISFQPPQTNF